MLIKNNILRRAAARSLVFASIAIGFGLANAQQSLAGCGGYCEARQALAVCHRAVEDQSLRTRERDAEFEKCKGDPARYLELQGIADEEERIFE